MATSEIQATNLAIGVIGGLPAIQGDRLDGADILRRMTGAEILGIGGAASGDFEGGGLIVDYRSRGLDYRTIFAFNELGMWVAFDGPKSNSATPA